jgi:dihydrofolate synthase / folylpolyglutamate synthase
MGAAGNDPGAEPVPGYRAALERLFALGQGRMLPGRDRLSSLLARAGDPHLAVPAVLVGGTNGKGKLTAALSAVLSQRFVTGAFLKPHLKSIRERWRIGDRVISPTQFVAAAQAACDLIDAHSEPISFFEANVLLGSLLFRDASCELAVWEVGLGGRHDACNLVEPLVSVITNVQYDHQAILGNTLTEIAMDKAGIARPGRPLLLGPARSGWEADFAEYAPVIEREARAVGAQFRAVEPEDYRPLFLLPDDTNALLQAALAELSAAGFGVNAGDVLAGLRQLHYRGRMEVTTLAGAPALLDAAHNPDSMRWLGRELKREGGRYVVVFGCQVSRDPADMLAPLAESVGWLVPIAVPVLHPCPVDTIIVAAEQLGLPVALPEGFEPGAVPADLPLDNRTELDPPDNSTGWIECVQHAAQLALREQSMLVVCGSIYYIGELLRAFEDGWVAT